MEIILQEDLRDLGFRDEVVRVRDGYARNFLIPKGLAIIANDTNRKVLAEKLKQRAFKEEKLRTAAEKIAASLKENTLKVGAKAGEKGKIFGSVTTLQIADAIEASGFTVDRKFITIKDEPIKTLGTYTADVRLHRDVHVTIRFEVVEE